MSTISKLAKGNLQSTKSKSILLIITIMLTTTLLTSVGITCVNWAEVNKEATIERSGSQHAIYKRAKINDVKVMGKNIDLELFGLLRTIGYSGYDESNLSLVYIDENTKAMSNVKFNKGNMPIKIDEIAIQDGYLNLLGVNYNVGDKIKVEYESRLTGEVKEREFTIAGVIETSPFNVANKNYTSIISEEFLIKEESSKDMEFNAYVRVEGEEKLSGENIKAKTKSVANDIGINEYEVRVNEYYIHAMKPDMEVVGGGIGIAVIVILSSILVIYSIFYVSIITKVQEYGKLRAIGATKKQIKGIIFREGMVLATIAIPTGLIIGYLIANTLVKKLLLMDEYIVGGFNLPIMLGVLLLSYLTVFISLLKPMKIASKVSPIEAIRYNGEDGNNKKNRKGYTEINIKRLTYANLSRNKKRTAITLISLSLSGIIFITMATVLSSLNAEKAVKTFMVGDFELNLDNYTYGNENEPLESDFNMVQENNPLGKELREDIRSIKGVKEIITNESTWIDYSDISGEKQKGSLGGIEEEDLEHLKEKLVDGEVNYESLKSGNGVIFTYASYAEEMGVEVGEKVKLTIYDGSRTFNKEFIVKAICNVGGADFLVSDNTLKELVKTDITTGLSIIIEENSKEFVKASLKQIADSNIFIELTSIDDEIETYEMLFKLTKTLGYALVIIIGVIGFMNLINTMITSIITRKRELGMLQAIGLSNKQLIKMLQIEGLFYTIGTLGVTLTLGNLIGYIAYSAFKSSGASYAVYSYPLTETIILIVAIIGVQLLLSYLVSNNFNKQSLVDRVRYSE